MNFINLTPHSVNIYGKGTDGNDIELISIPSDGLARCKVITKPVGDIKEVNGQDVVAFYESRGIELFHTEFGEVTGLPAPKENTIYIVSMLVRTALPNRKDLYSPGKLLRNNEGQPIGCLGLTR